MEIRRTRYFEGRNIYSYYPAVALEVDLGKYEGVSTKELPEFVRRVTEVLPGLKEHQCSLGFPGGFIRRMEEGTYFAHVLEHVILELQEMAGIGTKFGKARLIEKSLYRIVYECKSKKAGLFLGREAVKLVLGLLEGSEIAIQSIVAQAKKIAREESFGPSTASIIAEAQKRNIPILRIGDNSLLQLGYGAKQKRVQATITGNTSCIGVDIACDKSLTKELLGNAGIPVPCGGIALQQDEAVAIAKRIGFPVVVKPYNGNQGKGVTLSIKSEEEVRKAFEVAKNYSTDIIVERYIFGKHYRVLVVNQQVIAVAQRIPANVVGDGVHSVEKLIEMENNNPLRGEEHEKPLTKIKVEPVVLMYLTRQGITLQTVPKKGEQVFLRENANLSTGGIAIDVTDQVNKENIPLFLRVAKLIGLDIAGIDIVVKDIALPFVESGGAIIEVNAAPGIRMHHFPSVGKPRNVAGAIVDYLFPEGNGRIPIIAVTGTNGKTTTTRLLSHILQQKYVVGMTTTDGIYINDECILAGDNTGPVSSKAVLQNPDVEAAVLETARGGIIRGGLTYDWCDVGIVTNITDDHLGLDGIMDLEDLAYVKSLVPETVKKGGTTVLNADDSYTVAMAEKTYGNVIYFSMEPSNLVLRRHLCEGGKGVFCRDGVLVAADGNQEIEVCNIDRIPITLGGRAEHNIENAMAAFAGAWGLGFEMGAIIRGLQTFAENTGRLQICPVKDFKVVVDYGHNPAGFTRVLNAVKKFSPARLIGVVTIPGDRSKNTVIAAGKIAGKGFDYLVIKEDSDLRGRKEGEVASLLYQGAIAGGIKEENVVVIRDEKEAVEYALKQGRSGDLIVIFYEKYEKVMGVINTYLEKQEQLAVQENNLSNVPYRNGLLVNC